MYQACWIRRDRSVIAATTVATRSAGTSRRRAPQRRRAGRPRGCGHAVDDVVDVDAAALVPEHVEPGRDRPCGDRWPTRGVPRCRATTPSRRGPRGRGPTDALRIDDCPCEYTLAQSSSSQPSTRSSSPSSAEVRLEPSKRALGHRQQARRPGPGRPCSGRGCAATAPSAATSRARRTDRRRRSPRPRPWRACRRLCAAAASCGCHRAIDQSGLVTRSTDWCTTESPVHARCSRVGQST